MLPVLVVETGTDAVVVYGHDLAGLDIPDEFGAQAAQRAALRRAHPGLPRPLGGRHPSHPGHGPHHRPMADAPARQPLGPGPQAAVHRRGQTLVLRGGRRPMRVARPVRPLPQRDPRVRPLVPVGQGRGDRPHQPRRPVPQTQPAQIRQGADRLGDLAARPCAPPLLDGRRRVSQADGHSARQRTRRHMDGGST